MVADYFTKPLQGELFYKFRDQILGVVPMETIVGDHRSVLDHDSTKAPNEGSGAKGARWASSGPTDDGRPLKAVVRPTPKSRKRARSKTNKQTKVSQDRRTWAEVAKTPPLQYAH
jgi:hypothetical protein